jgi:outer membrane receptor protein involved in Fe transport
VSAESAVGRTTSTVAQNNSEERVASVDLRGLGAESTLTLLNGRRLAGALNGRVVDISSIPLSALERVDVVTGGASAIYGADAVGGVVNLVTRRPESGAESQFTASRGRDGGGRLQVSQSAGWRGDQGGLLAAYEFQYDEPLDLTDGALFRTPSASGVSYNSLFLQPLERRHSIFLTGDYGLGERVKAYGNSLLSSKDISSNQHYKYDGASGDTSDDYKTDSEQFAATAGIVAELTANWSLDVALSTSRYQRETDTESHYVFPGLPASFERQGVASSEVELWSGSAIVQGVPFYLGGHEVRVATGAEFRKERLDTNSAYTGFFPTTIRYQDSRSIRSVFGELRLPIGEGRGGPGALLELSAAGRYDDYSDFGDSFNPLVGAIIRPVKGFTVRGNYSRAFRAPALIDTTPEYSAYLDRLPDPASATGQTTVFSAVGGDPGLKPERAKAWTLSIDVQPAALTGMFASVSYFDVHYRDRIATPAPYPDDLTVLQHLDIYSPVLNLAPQEADFTRLLSGAATFVDNLGTTFNADEPASALTLFPDAVIFDNRTTNVSLERVRGVDGLLSYSAPAGAGELKVALNGSYTLAHDSSITATSPTVSRLNDLGKPVDFRARIFIGWSTQTWTVSLSGNYVDGYENTSSAPPASVDSWLTADLGVGLRTAALVDGGLWDDLQLSLSVQNLFDSDPPFADDFSRLLYDPTNANALGRIVVMRIGKRW